MFARCAGRVPGVLGSPRAAACAGCGRIASLRLKDANTSYGPPVVVRVSVDRFQSPNCMSRANSYAPRTGMTRLGHMRANLLPPGTARGTLSTSRRARPAHGFIFKPGTLRRHPCISDTSSSWGGMLPLLTYPGGPAGAVRAFWGAVPAGAAGPPYSASISLATLAASLMMRPRGAPTSSRNSERFPRADLGRHPTLPASLRTIRFGCGGDVGSPRCVFVGARTGPLLGVWAWGGGVGGFCAPGWVGGVWWGGAWGVTRCWLFCLGAGGGGGGGRGAVGCGWPWGWCRTGGGGPRVGGSGGPPVRRRGARGGAWPASSNVAVASHAPGNPFGPRRHGYSQFWNDQ